MLPKAENACFAIADISGYTHFVSGVELDHAHDIIADIMDMCGRSRRCKKNLFEEHEAWSGADMCLTFSHVQDRRRFYLATAGAR